MSKTTRGTWRNPKKINKIVDVLLSRWQGKAEKYSMLLKTGWKQAAGERIAEHTHPDRLQRGRLYVLVESSAWMNELTFLKEQIKIECKKLYAQNGLTVEDIIFKIGPK